MPVVGAFNLKFISGTGGLKQGNRFTFFVSVQIDVAIVTFDGPLQFSSNVV